MKNAVWIISRLNYQLVYIQQKKRSILKKTEPKGVTHSENAFYDGDHLEQSSRHKVLFPMRFKNFSQRITQQSVLCGETKLLPRQIFLNDSKAIKANSAILFNFSRCSLRIATPILVLVGLASPTHIFVRRYW